MTSDNRSLVSPVRYPEDLDLAEGALDGDAEAVGTLKMMLEDPALGHWLVQRGATSSEARDLLDDLWGDLFGGEKKRGGIHRILGKFNGACRLMSFLRRVALNRLISLKRKGITTVSLDGNSAGDDERAPVDILAASTRVASEDAIVELLASAVMGAFAEVDQEKLLLFRLCQSYGLSQKRVGEMWNWHDSKVSRGLAGFGEELRDAIMASIHESDPWLEIEWHDFLDLCGEAIDLFAYSQS